MKRRTLFLSLTIAILAVISHWLSQETEQLLVESTTTPTPVRSPDYFMDNFSAVTMNENGITQHRLEAVRLEHYAQDDTTELNQPHLVFYDNSTPLWHITAARGNIKNDTQTIYLEGKVHLQREGDAPQELRTENIQIHPKTQYAETDAAVTLTSPQVQLQGVGMRVYLNDERLQLLSHVRGHYVQ
ncbi:MAG: LPS export ABC transporter periplasmic protein LptC [Gammaproteobacteria bacterium]|nr:LPS export ABC transporter periplasmic protein LptC [Gammaproteobacteria bacterium]